jgi:hypothetical protein
VARWLVEGQDRTALLHLDFRQADNLVSDAALLEKLKNAVGYVGDTAESQLTRPSPSSPHFLPSLP